MQRKVLPGSPYPLGATVDGRGTNFAIFSDHAEKVELCLFDSPGAVRETERIILPEQTDMIWHGHISGISAGQLYGFRVHGPYDPQNGHRFNPNKVVLDPYAKEIGRNLCWSDELFGYRINDPDADLSFDDRDDAACAPLGMVVDPAFSWGDDRPPRIPWNDTIIYETHVKGFTKRYPGLPEQMRGTYVGFASDVVIQYLQELGITAVEFLPIHHHVDARYLVDRGLKNYWGYDTLAYFAPDNRYAMGKLPGDANREFKRMVSSLHAAGIEVILDVVYNHTGEGNQMGPTLSLRGIDNNCYYRLVQEDPRFYFDYTGTGNTLNMVQPHVLQMVMDSLRYWVIEMHVDGFRFDLASTLARELHAVNRLSAFFDIIHQDPVLSVVKLIAEPWDLGEGGYQVGNFPVGWAEWNGKYRDISRVFWKGDDGYVAELATRLCGSSDLYANNGRKPYASVNFITCHDGLTLNDLVSYNEKHNDANGEGNHDGSDDNRSWNCGVEGPTSDAMVLELRERQKRNFLAFLMVSQGIPMISGGDEISRTQQGNNNAYCQDNEISWYDWELDGAKRALLDFAQRVIRFRREHPSLHRRRFFQDRPIRGMENREIMWLTPAGEEMSDTEWGQPWQRSLYFRLSGAFLDTVDQAGDPVVDNDLLILMNSWHEPALFGLPPGDRDMQWELAFDTARPTAGSVVWSGEWKYEIGARSLAVFVAPKRASVIEVDGLPGERAQEVRRDAARA